MFTGIIEELGEVLDIAPSGDGLRLKLHAPLAVSDASHGDSIAVSGVCLTVVERGADWFTADVMAQTVSTATTGSLQVGDRVNLERAAKVGDRLGGHIVQGHVDGTTSVLTVTPGEQWRVLRLALPEHIAALVVDKGSITIDGVSLTVSAIGEDAAADGSVQRWFEVSLIPETLSATTLGARRAGDRVNVESDILARHVQRLITIGGRS